MLAHWQWRGMAGMHVTGNGSKSLFFCGTIETSNVSYLQFNEEGRMHTANTISPAQLRAFFHPRSIALVGATDNSRWSIYTYQNLKTFGYAGPIYCVNPRYKVIHGQAAVKRLSDIQEPVDLAFIMVPTGRVYEILEEIAAVHIPNAVILTSGFREMGE